MTIPVVATTLTIAAVLVAVFGRRRRKKKKKESKREGNRRPRRWSDSSAGLAAGAFPAKVNYDELIINAAIFFRECPKKEDIITKVVPKILEYERMSSIPDPLVSRSCFPIGNLDRTKLVRHRMVDCDRDGIFKQIEGLLHDSLKEGRDGLPWWEFVLLENKGSGESVLVLRLNHGLADGLSLLGLVEEFVTLSDGTPVRDVIPQNMRKRQKQKSSGLGMIWSHLVSLGRVISLPSIGNDDDNMFSRGNYNGMVHNHNRKIVRFEPIPTDFIRKLKETACVSFHEIVFTCFCNTIQGYLELTDCPVYKAKRRGVKCRAITPFGFPKPIELLADKTRALNNQWVLMSLGMHLGYDDIVDQLKAVSAAFAKIKGSPYPSMMMALQNSVLDCLPFEFVRQNIYNTLWRHSLSLSSVPGPQNTSFVAGKEASEVQFFVSNLIPQAGLISYAGKLMGSIVLDPVAVPQSEAISFLFSNAFVKLAERLGVDCPEKLVSHASQGLSK